MIAFILKPTEPNKLPEELVEPDSVDDMVDFKRTPTERPSEPTPTAFDKNEQQFFPSSPQVRHLISWSVVLSFGSIKGRSSRRCRG